VCGSVTDIKATTLDTQLCVPFTILRILNASFHKQYYQAGICNARAGILCELQVKILITVRPNKFKIPTLHATTDFSNAETRCQSRS
jgi:hypothetical protein